MVADVMPLAEQDEVADVRAPAVQPVEYVVGVQVLRVRAARMRAMTLLA